MKDKFVCNPAYPLELHSPDDFMQSVSSRLDAPLAYNVNASSLLSLYFPLESAPETKNS